MLRIFWLSGMMETRSTTPADKGEHVFVVGSSRSGTTLVYSILQASCLYARYPAENKLLNACKAKYGDLKNGRSRNRFLEDWLRSVQFKRSGLTKEKFMSAFNGNGASTYPAVLGLFMNLVAAEQQCERWIDDTPDNVFSLREISDQFPDARVIHVIRDGRAVALSLARLGWCGVRTDNFDKALCYSALKWQQSVAAGRKAAVFLGDRYFELSYEQLVQDYDRVVNELCRFLDIPPIDSEALSGGRINVGRNPESSLGTPNTPFDDLSTGISDKAAFRWKTALTGKQISMIEGYVGRMLTDLGYPLVGEQGLPAGVLFSRLWRRSILNVRKYLKHNTMIGRLSSTPLEISPE
jgi:hypothetical protein